MLPGKPGSTLGVLGLIKMPLRPDIHRSWGVGGNQQMPTEAPGQANCKHPSCLECWKQIRQEAARIMLLEVNTAWGSVT